MQPDTVLARMKAARSELERACAALIHPTLPNAGTTLAALTSAARILETLPGQMKGCTGDASLLAEAGRLREGVRRSGLLLKTAADHRARWLRLLLAQVGGYTAEGMPAGLSGTTGVCLRG